MKILSILGIILLFAILTTLSQVGGVILLLWLLVFWSFKKKIKNAWVRRGVHVGGFVVFYMLFVLAIIPMLARLQHRAPLPMTKSGNLVPVTYWNVVFMRNYIITSGKEKMVKIADEFGCWCSGPLKRKSKTFGREEPRIFLALWVFTCFLSWQLFQC